MVFRQFWEGFQTRRKDFRQFWEGFGRVFRLPITTQPRMTLTYGELGTTQPHPLGGLCPPRCVGGISNPKRPNPTPLPDAESPAVTIRPTCKTGEVVAPLSHHASLSGRVCLSCRTLVPLTPQEVLRWAPLGPAHIGHGHGFTWVGYMTTGVCRRWPSVTVTARAPSTYQAP